MLLTGVQHVDRFLSTEVRSTIIIIITHTHTQLIESNSIQIAASAESLRTSALTGVQHVDRFLSTEVSPIKICVSIIAYSHTNTLTTKSIDTIIKQIDDELSLSAQVLLTGVQHVDRFLSTEVRSTIIIIITRTRTHTTDRIKLNSNRSICSVFPHKCSLLEFSMSTAFFLQR